MSKAHARSTVVSGVILIVGLGAALLLLGGTVASLQVHGARRIEPILPPSQQSASRRLTFDDLVYQGAFRVPAEGQGDNFSYGGQTLAYNPAANTLLVGSRHGKVAEVTIPPPVKGTRVEELPVATYLAPFRDPADGHIRDIADDGAALDGLLIHDGRLY